jgi:hypothetical protein
MFIGGMIGIVKSDVERIVEGGLRLVKRDGVLGEIERSLLLVPFKSHGG